MFACSPACWLLSAGIASHGKPYFSSDLAEMESLNSQSH
jgi:hypothetical protein